MFDFMDFDPSAPGEYHELSGPIVPEPADCMRCGLCLRSCPTYQLSGDEQEGPRQRIRTLSRLLLEQQAVTPEAIAHLQNCVQCRACEAVCPSQMDYAELYEQAQAQLTEGQQRGLCASTALFLVAHRAWLNALLPLIKFYQVSGLRRALIKLKVLDRLGLSRVDRIAPEPILSGMKPCYPVSGAKGSVALFTGCIGDRFDRETLLAAIKVLNHIGYTVLVPGRQNCCGAIHYHNGERETAEDLMRRNVEVFSALRVEAVIYCATGCGSQLQDSARILQDEAGPAFFDDKLFDICEFVDSHWPEDLHLQACANNVRVHEPCSQRNVLQTQSSVYSLLRRVPEMSVTELADNHVCCGAGGSYLLTHPDQADALRELKWGHVRDSACDYLLTSNIGCALQLSSAEAVGTVRIIHPIQLIAELL